MKAAPLNRRQAEALIASRLASLGHPAEFIAPDATKALIARSGDVQGLQAALAATLFLASTEDAPQIGRTHVERAVPTRDFDVASPHATTRRGWPKLAAIIGACVGLAGLGLAGWLLVGHLGPKPAPGRIAIQIAPAFKPAPPLLVLQKPSQSAIPATPADKELPDTPPAVIRLAAHTADADALARLTDAASHLAQASIGKIEIQARSSPIECAGVCYFFVEDAALASNVAKLLAQATNRAVPEARAAPALVLQTDGRPPRPPGTIEAYVP